MTAAYRVDGVEVDDTTFYAVACDPQRSVVVEACAGAGKTWMLVSRILRALLDGVDPEQILAITFTRKAAGEMQGRLDEWLGQFASDCSTAAERVTALRQRGLAPAEAERHQQALGDLRQRLLRRPRGVEVRTFHAWFAQLAGHLPLQLRTRLGLPAQPTLLEDITPLTDDLFRRFRLVVHADPSLRDDHDQLVLRHRRSGVQAWLETAWLRGEEVELADRDGVLATSMPTAAELDARCAGLSHPLELLAIPSTLSAWQTAVVTLSAQKGVKAVEAAGALDRALQAARGGQLALARNLAWAALFTQSGTLRKALEKLPGLPEVAEELGRVKALCDQQDARDDHLRMVRLSRVLRHEYGALKRSRSLVDMADLERAAMALLGDPATAGWVQHRLDLRIQQVLIDEFQDTSPLQWHALFGWLSAYAGAGGGASGQRPPGVFIVGDPKQSIYRFRRAEPRVFEAASSFVVNGLAGHVLACDHTRRNAPALVAALNQVFGDAAVVDGWGPFRPHTTGSHDPGSLWDLPGVPRPPANPPAVGTPRWRDSLTEPRHLPDEHVKLTEARLVASHLRAAVASGTVEPGRVMVLSRRRSMLRLVAGAMAELGLPCVMPESVPLSEPPEAQDLIALLDALASPGQDLSLARALKSPLLACTDDDLMALSRHARRARSGWLDALTAAPSPPGSDALQRARGLLIGWRSGLTSLTPHDLLARIAQEGDLVPRVLAATPAPRRPVALQVLRGLFQAAIEHDGGRFVSTYRFVRALKQGVLKAAPAVPADAVQLLTVHGAKGLEADWVYLVDTRPEFRRPERATLLVDWPVEAAAPRRVAFVGSESRMPPALRDLLQQELLERQREEINGLYVALTRARRHVVVSHTEPHMGGSGRSWWHRLQPVLQPAQAHAGVAAEPPGMPDVRFEVLPVVSPPAVGPGAAVDPAAADPRAAALGRAVHRVLEWLGQPGAERSHARGLRAAEQAAATFGLSPDVAAEVAAVAARIVDSPDCARFFVGPALAWVGNEVPVAGSDGQLMRIDRLVQLADAQRSTWWVLDYKLHHSPEQLAAYRLQLRQYRLAVEAALRAQGDADPDVRSGFINGAGRFIEG